MHLLLPYLGLLFGVTVLRSAAGYFYTYGQNELGQLLMTDVRTALYRKLLVLPYSFYDREQTGRLISRLSSDVESTRLFLSQILIESFSHATTIVLATAAMFAQDLGLALLVAGPLIASGVGMYWPTTASARPGPSSTSGSPGCPPSSRTSWLASRW